MYRLLTVSNMLCLLYNPTSKVLNNTNTNINI